MSPCKFWSTASKLQRYRFRKFGIVPEMMLISPCATKGQHTAKFRALSSLFPLSNYVFCYQTHASTSTVCFLLSHQLSESHIIYIITLGAFFKKPLLPGSAPSSSSPSSGRWVPTVLRHATCLSAARTEAHTVHSYSSLRQPTPEANNFRRKSNQCYFWKNKGSMVGDETR